MRTRKWTLAAAVAATVYATPAYAKGIIDLVYDSAPKDIVDVHKGMEHVTKVLKDRGQETVKSFQFACGHVLSEALADGSIGVKTTECISTVAQGIVRRNQKQAELDTCTATGNDCSAKLAAVEAERDALKRELAALQARGVSVAGGDTCGPVERVGPCRVADVSNWIGVCDPHSQMLRCDPDSTDPTVPRFMCVPKCQRLHPIANGGGWTIGVAGTARHEKETLSFQAGVPEGYFDPPAIPLDLPPVAPTTWFDRNWGWLAAGGIAAVGGTLGIVALTGGFDRDVYIGGQRVGGDE